MVKGHNDTSGSDRASLIKMNTKKKGDKLVIPHLVR